jgi:DNA polymerase I
MSENFSSVVVCDFEYEITADDLPDPLCMVAYVLDENLQHVRTIRMWRDDFGKTPPFDTGADTLFVAYSAWAEMTCFMVLGWQFPAHIFDQHTAYLAASNILLRYDPDEVRKKPRKRLSDACRIYGLDGWERINKENIAKAIGDGTWRGRYSPGEVLDYCTEDVRMEVQLLRAQLRPHRDQRDHVLLPAADVERVLWWSNYSAKAVARIQARGMPIDMTLWNLVQENKAAVVGELLQKFDPSHDDDDPIYTSEGKWSYARFERWLVRSGVIAWPRLESGKLDTDGDAFDMMFHIAGVTELHALRDSLGFIVKARLPIGRDGRNRPSLFPFGTATGRNAHAKSLFNAHAGMRSFLVFSPDSIGVYLDWRSQEIGVAAVQSGDAALMDAYRSGDIYHALALMCGITQDPDPVHWKKHSPDMRQRMKALQLGINYGMGVPSLARGLHRHPLIASEIIERHRRTYPRFWQWRANKVQIAMLERRIESVFGWPLRITTSPNERTLYNFPMQSGGAEMLRLAAWRLCEAGIVPSMLIHDGILLEVTDQEQIELAKEIMRAAARDTCDGFEIGVDVDQMLVGGARYHDKRPMAVKMWNTIMHTLEAVKAMPRQAVE